MLLACGDALIDFIPGRPQEGRPTFLPYVGGSCLNVAVTMARLEAPAGFLGAISTDFLGDMIADHASASGVSLQLTDRLSFPSTAAFVEFNGGEPRYLFYDDGTASRHWTHPPSSKELSRASAIHFGSTTLVHEDQATRALAVLKAARGRSTISFDPNCRPHLVRDRAPYLTTIEEFARNSDLIKMSDADFEFLYGHRDFERKASQFLAAGAALVCITRGEKSTLAYYRAGGLAEVSVNRVQERDTIGAGDTFSGALLVAVNENGLLGSSGLLQLRSDDVSRLVRFASNCAGLTCERVGADPPRKHEIPAAWWSEVKIAARSN
jgi:fructokinase